MILNRNLCSLIDNITIEDFLVKELKISRSRVKQFLNRKQLNKVISKNEPFEIPVELLNHNIVNPIFTGEIPKIIYEDDRFLIIDKPHGLHCHPLGYGESDNVMSFFRANNCFDVLKVNAIAYDRGLLFRLDQVTSGLLVFTKQQAIYDEVRSNFNLIAKEKVYQAIVEGELKGSIDLDEYMTSTGKKGSKMKVSELGEKATLSVKAIKYDSSKDITLVEVILNTGVRHQIRCQLANLGNPIVGDTLYGAKASDRVYLHAHRYSFTIDNRVETFTSEVSLAL